MKELDVKQNTPKWLEARKQYRTASEAAIVMGISPFTTPTQFKKQKLGLAKQYYSKAMKLGHDLEDQVRQWTNKTLGLNFIEACWVNGKYMASLDGIDGKILVEIKVSDRTYNDIKDGLMPEYYNVQMQQQMYCSPATSGYLVAYSPKEDKYAISEPVYEWSDFLATIKPYWEAFDALEVPEEVDATGDGTIINLFQEYELLKREADSLKQQMDEIKAKLVDQAHDKTLVAGDYKLERKAGAKRVDYKTACRGIDLAPYTKVGEASFAIKLPKNPFND